MNEIFRLDGENSDRYEYYEDLLCKREAYAREADSVLLSFNKEFGQKIKENFELKIACVEFKKRIAYCQKQINYGKSIKLDLMEVYIERDMLQYYNELKEIINQYEAGKNSVRVEEWKIRRAKSIYRKFTKRLHPDINKKTTDNPKLFELWNRIIQAYHHSDVEELENLEVLAGRVLAELEGNAFEYSFSNVEERIRRVERQIREIISSEPYTLLKLLDDDEFKRKKHEDLDREYSEYAQYREKLKTEFEGMLCKGGISFAWKMN